MTEMLPRVFPLLAVAAVLGLNACGANEGAEPTRTYELGLTVDDSEDEYDFIASDPFDIQAGDEVTFEMLNTGDFRHDLQIVGPDGIAVATADPVPPGATLTLTALFEEPGIYQLNCLIDNHLTEHNMQALVQVTESDE